MKQEHRVGTRDEWLTARRELLLREKELTHDRDELARERRELPWVRLGKSYSFETEGGTRTLKELFDGRSQLLVYHTYSCYARGLDGINGTYQLLDLAPKRRDEDDGMAWVRRHDAYEDAAGTRG